MCRQSGTEDTNVGEHAHGEASHDAEHRCSAAGNHDLVGDSRQGQGSSSRRRVEHAGRGQPQHLDRHGLFGPQVAPGRHRCDGHWEGSTTPPNPPPTILFRGELYSLRVISI